jgi:4-hydroxy-tetrahydrodipicolinate reductase
MGIRICVSGATGWVGRALVPAVVEAGDLELVAAVARTAAGRDVGEVVGIEPVGVPVAPSLGEALRSAAADVLIDYTAPGVVRSNVGTALELGMHVVIGTSGLTGEDYAEIDRAARGKGVGVVAAGNFSLTAALLQHLAMVAARHVPHWEIVDYASTGRPHVPSGTARELAERLSAEGPPEVGVPLDQLQGPKEARGADIAGTRVHSVRSPGYVLSAEIVFGMAGERLTLRHDAYEGAGPYVAGTLLAARRAPNLRGLVRGLDRLLFG